MSHGGSDRLSPTCTQKWLIKPSLSALQALLICVGSTEHFIVTATRRRWRKSPFKGIHNSTTVPVSLDSSNNLGQVSLATTGPQCDSSETSWMTSSGVVGVRGRWGGPGASPSRPQGSTLDNQPITRPHRETNKLSHSELASRACFRTEGRKLENPERTLHRKDPGPVIKLAPFLL